MVCAAHRLGEIGVVDELAQRFDGAGHIAPTDVETALAQHGHPTDILEAVKGETEGGTLERFEESATERAPDEDHAQPAGERDHDERKEEHCYEEFVRCGPMSGMQQESLQALNVAAKDADREQAEIDGEEDPI